MFSVRRLFVGAALLPIVCTAGGASEETTVKDFMFEPMSLTVEAGATVTWLNLDDEPHTVVDDAGTVRSGALDTGGRFNIRFDKPGTYHFIVK